VSHKGKIAAAIAAVIVVAIAALPFFINVNSFRPVLEKQLTTALNRPVTLGKLSLSLFSGSVVAHNLTIADDPKFGTSPFLTASALRFGVEMRPLLFERKILIRSLEIDSPQIHLVYAAGGVWNFSTIGQAAASHIPDSLKEPSIPNLTIDSFLIKAGHATVEGMPAVGKPLVYDQVDVSVQGFSFAKQFPFALSANLPGEATLALNGKAGPVDTVNAARTSFDAQLVLRHFDPVTVGVLDKSAGITVLADVDARAVSNGTTVSSNGTVHAGHLQLRPNSVPTPKPVDISYNVIHNLSDNTGHLQDATFQTGKLAAHLNGDYTLQPSTVELNLKLAGQNLPIDELQGLIPAVGVKLPNNSVLQGGTLTTNLNIVGPVQDPVITGPAQLNNTRLVGFNMSAQLTGIASMAMGNTGNITNIQTLRLNLKVTKAGVVASNVYAALPTLGEAVGSGTVSPAGALNFKLSMKMDTSRGISGKAVGLMAKLNGTADKTAAQSAATGVPVAITGTSGNPIITPDVKGMMKSNASSILSKQKDNSKKVIGKIGGLFGKKS
jgi:AsmA protein